MAPNGSGMCCRDSKTMLLYTGNIMTDECRGRFLNTTMAKSNAEVDPKGSH